MSEKTLVKPDSPGGFITYLPQKAIPRQEILQKIRKVFERFGFDPLETPAVEYLDVLTGGDDDFDMTLYEARRVRGETVPNDPIRTALRFDHTVPLARVVVANWNELPRPFKRYVCGNVWRGEKPQAGRYREFMQFDADIVGSSSMLADAEIIALMCATILDLGIDRFKVRFNNRKILNGLPAFAGFDPGLIDQVLRQIDKLEKIGEDGVRQWLGNEPKPTMSQAEAQKYQRWVWNLSEEEKKAEKAKIYGLGLPQEAVDKIMAFVAFEGTSDELLDQVEGICEDNAAMTEGLAELREIIGYLRTMGVDESNWEVDLSVARGLAYYSGPVFETTLLDCADIGSVFSGGRFDFLVQRFQEDSIPATGASIGVDRFFAALKELGMVPSTKTTVQALVTVMDQALMPEYLQLVGALRNSGMNAALYMAEEMVFKAQLAFAVKQEIPYVLIMGQREADAGEVTIKDMNKREQRTVSKDVLLGGRTREFIRAFVPETDSD